MHIKRKDGVMTMSELLVCSNYSDMRHFKSTFDKVGDNRYQCKECEQIIIVKEPVLVHDDKGMLKMQVVVETE